jgi:predicted acyl esterase
MVACAFGAAPASATAPDPTFGYATMSDGTKIAVAVSYPDGFSSQAKWPTLFEMDGYEGGASPEDPADWDNRFVIVHASVRGTGCSGGRFDLFDQTTAQDGRQIIDDWIPKQTWSNGDVGIIGHSYPGLTGFAVAETNPSHLRAIAVSGLIDDLYRGVTYIGGIPDAGFPILWNAVDRPASEQSGNASRYSEETTGGDPTCAQNIATRPPPNVLDDPILNGAVGREDGTWWQAHSLITGVGGIAKPIQIIQQYQDEQTGPRGGVVLWQHIPAGVPKRLLLTNGVHATNWALHRDVVGWLECWMLDHGSNCPDGVADPQRRVQVHFETTGSGNDPQLDTLNAPYVSSDYPLPETDWRRYYLRADGSLTEAAPAPAEAPRTYVQTSEGRQAYVSGAGVADATGSIAETTLDGAYRDDYGPATAASGPDEQTWALPRVTAPTTIAGPLAADLWLSSTAPDTDVFVQLIDEDAQGDHAYLQRGMLRASFRAVDPDRSDRVQDGPLAGAIYRPFHPFTDPALLTPGQPVELQIEIFPLGHVLRPGHRLLVQVYSPPVADELNSYATGQPPAVNTILEDDAHRSSLLVPWLAATPPIAAKAPACGTQTGVRCVKPAS